MNLSAWCMPANLPDSFFSLAVGTTSRQTWPSKSHWFRQSSEMSRTKPSPHLGIVAQVESCPIDLPVTPPHGELTSPYRPVAHLDEAAVWQRLILCILRSVLWQVLSHGLSAKLHRQVPPSADIPKGHQLLGQTLAPRTTADCSRHWSIGLHLIQLLL